MRHETYAVALLRQRNGGVLGDKFHVTIDRGWIGRRGGRKPECHDVLVPGRLFDKTTRLRRVRTVRKVVRFDWCSGVLLPLLFCFYDRFLMSRAWGSSRSSCRLNVSESTA